MSQKKQTVLHFIDSGGLYGAESVLLNLSRLMLQSGRFEPVVGCIVDHADAPSDLHDKARELGIRAEKIVIRNSRLLIDLPRAARRLKAMGVDLIHSHGYKPSVFGFAIKKMTGIEIMATCHLWFKGGQAPLKMRVMVWLELKLYRFFKVVVGVSEPIKQVLVDAGVAPERILVVKNGVDMSASPPVSESQKKGLRERLGLSQENYCIVNSGRLTKQKAQKDIVSAAAILRDKGMPFRIYIVGDGELRGEIEERIRSLGVGEFVSLLGFRTDILEILKAADLFILPSLDEGMPMGMLEASALAVPVVASPVGDIPLLIEHKVSGYLVEPGDPMSLADGIAELLENQGMARMWAEEAKGRVRREFSSESMFAKYSEIYLSIA